MGECKSGCQTSLAFPADPVYGGLSGWTTPPLPAGLLLAPASAGSQSHQPADAEPARATRGTTDFFDCFWGRGVELALGETSGQRTDLLYA